MNLLNLRMLKGTLSLDAAHIVRKEIVAQPCTVTFIAIQYGETQPKQHVHKKLLTGLTVPIKSN